uniref:Uncharacterized protein n=2 Tax=Parascaris univalens TaxID=6257 RepID=A0A914ZEV5_PARUN
MKRFIMVTVNFIVPTLWKVERHQQTLSDLLPLVRKSTEYDTQLIVPLSAFIDNRAQMVEEMFASLSREELRLLLPDSLTHIQRAELMDLCIDELEGMSKKRITAVLEGRNLWFLMYLWPVLNTSNEASSLLIGIGKRNFFSSLVQRFQKELLH